VGGHPVANPPEVKTVQQGSSCQIRWRHYLNAKGGLHSASFITKRFPGAYPFAYTFSTPFDR